MYQIQFTMGGTIMNTKTYLDSFEVGETIGVDATLTDGCTLSEDELKDKRLRQHLRGHNLSNLGVRTAKVIYAGPYFITVKYCNTKRTTAKNDWSESFDITQINLVHHLDGRKVC